MKTLINNTTVKVKWKWILKLSLNFYNAIPLYYRLSVLSMEKANDYIGIKSRKKRVVKHKWLSITDDNPWRNWDCIYMSLISLLNVILIVSFAHLLPPNEESLFGFDSVNMDTSPPYNLLSVHWRPPWNKFFDLITLFVPKTVPWHHVTPRGVVYFQSAMLSALLIYFLSWSKN